MFSEASDGGVGGSIDFLGQGDEVAEAFDVAGGDAAAVGGHDAAYEVAVVVVLDSGPGPSCPAVGRQCGLDTGPAVGAGCGHGAVSSLVGGGGRERQLDVGGEAVEPAEQLWQVDLWAVGEVRAVGAGAAESSWRRRGASSC